MTTYFAAASDKTLLPLEQQSYQDLASLSAEVELDVIQQYTIRADDVWYRIPSLNWQQGVSVGAAALGRWVMLLGYKVDAADAAVDADLKDALRRTIAH